MGLNIMIILISHMMIVKSVPVSEKESGVTKQIRGASVVIDRKRKIYSFKRGKSSEGFTLVEVLVSLAILTIVSIALLLLFNQSFDGIIKSGKKAKMIYGNQETLETMISERKAPDDDPDITEEALDLEIYFHTENSDLIKKEITVKGKLLTKDNLTVFIPNS